MKKEIKLLLKSLLMIGWLFVGVHSALAVTSFSFSVPEGQGGSGNEFYHGRCVRADVMLDTDGHNTGGADLEINYDNSRISIVNSDCSTPATTIYTGTQYDNYTNNHVTTNKITLGAYDNPGNSYNGNGRFAYFYFIVLDGAGNYDLDFEFTPGNTTDTNLAETGTGNDILEQADSYTLHFADDDDTPYVNNENPANGATNVSVVTNLLYRLNDDDAGVDFSSLTDVLTGANWGTTSYTAGSGQISHSCQTTNANRVPYCDVTLNPSHNLWYCEHYTQDISVSDLGNPTVHSLNNYIYSFDTEPDNDAPEVYNRNPGAGAVNIATGSNIEFNLHDLANPGGYAGTGVNISTLSVTISASGWGSQTYTTASAELTATPLATNDYGNVFDYAISIDPNTDFPENTTVTVVVDVDDYGCPTINHQQNTYTFTTADTQGPVCTLFTPTPNIVNMGTADDITFHCTDSGVGVDINTVSAIVDGIEYTAGGANTFSYTGTPADYFITVDPATDFSVDYALEVIVNARDFSGNGAQQVSFGLATGVNGSCPICNPCPVCEECEECDDCEEETEVITKYKECTVVNKIMGGNVITKWLPAKSKVTAAQLDNIKLEEINDVDIHIGNRSLTDNLQTAIVGGEKQVLVTVTDEKVVFEGVSLPNVQVTLMIESDPIIVTGVADDNGRWRITTANIFTNGIHKVSAVTMSEDNYIIKTKPLGKFKVSRFRICPLWCCLIIALLIVLLLIVIYKYKRLKQIFCTKGLSKTEKEKLKRRYCLAKRGGKKNGGRKKRVVAKKGKKALRRSNNKKE
jgi:hypothetical protein